LLEAERWIVQSDRLWRFTVLELPNDVGQWHTAPDQVQTIVPAFDELPGSWRPRLSVVSADWAN
jgi:hypothetical protein